MLGIGPHGGGPLPHNAIDKNPARKRQGSWREICLRCGFAVRASGRCPVPRTGAHGVFLKLTVCPAGPSICLPRLKGRAGPVRSSRRRTRTPAMTADGSLFRVLARATGQAALVGGNVEPLPLAHAAMSLRILAIAVSESSPHAMVPKNVPSSSIRKIEAVWLTRYSLDPSASTFSEKTP